MTLVERARAAGRSLAWLAERLALGLSTVREWLRRARRGELVARRRGRPRADGKTARRAVLELLAENAQLGARRLARIFGLSRRTVADWKTRVVSWQARRRKRALQSCRWTTVGSVWAMDHTELDARVAGGTSEVWVVRDLASGMLLATEPARLRTGVEVAAELALLFLEHGAPLVMKSDNGSMLVCREVRAVCEAWGVVLVRSPVRSPAFNGGCERSLGWWKTHVEPLRGDGVLDHVDLERGRELANVLPRERGPSAAEKWSRRAGIPVEERARFLAAFGEELEARELGDGVPNELFAPNGAFGVTLRRRAASAALRKLGYLWTRRCGEAAGEKRP